MTDQHCTICGQPATMLVRNTQETLPKRDDCGRLWRTYQPVGEPEPRCPAHAQHRTLPMSDEDAARLKLLEKEWAEQDKEKEASDA